MAIVKLIDTPADPVRLAFLHVFNKREGMQQPDGSTGTAKYEATAIFKPGGENEKRLKAAIAEVAKEKYGDNWAAEYKDDFADDQRGLRRGSGKKTKDGDVYDGFDGMSYVVARTTKRPTVINRDRTPLTEEDGVIYSGAYGTVHVDVWALAKRGVKRRIVTDLLGVQFTRDGDAFGGGSAPAKADDFDDLGAGDEPAASTDEDPFA